MRLERRMSEWWLGDVMSVLKKQLNEVVRVLGAEPVAQSNSSLNIFFDEDGSLGPVKCYLTGQPGSVAESYLSLTRSYTSYHIWVVNMSNRTCGKLVTVSIQQS